MRGLLERAREKGQAALDRAAHAGAGAGGGVRGAVASSVPCGGAGEASLDAALRRVTYSDCAAVPAADLREATRLAAETEEALAVALRHVLENVSAPLQEWRRIHGALQLLEQLLRRGASSGGDEVLVGRIWFEAKMQRRLEELSSFENPEDKRVALLVRRTAAAVQSAAKRSFQRQAELEREVHSSIVNGHAAFRSGSGGGEQQVAAALPPPLPPETSGGGSRGEAGGRGSAAATPPPRIPAAAVIGRPGPRPEAGTGDDASPNSVDSSPGGGGVPARGRRRRSANQERAGGAAEPLPRRCCRWLWPPQAQADSPSTGGRRPKRHSEAGSDTSAADEGDLLLKT